MVRKIVRPRRLQALRSSCRPRGNVGDGSWLCRALFRDHYVDGKTSRVVRIHYDLRTILVVACPARLPTLVEDPAAATTKVARSFSGFGTRKGPGLPPRPSVFRSKGFCLGVVPLSCGRSAR